MSIAKNGGPRATIVPPGAWLGLLGGGQLGRMFCMGAQSLGYKVVVLDPGRDGPAASVADRHICADYMEPNGLRDLATIASAVTTEFENVPAAALRYLATTVRVCPGAESVAIAQDRIREKGFLASHDFRVVPYAVLERESDIEAVDSALVPGIVKSARMGYDGKGQIRVSSRAEIEAAWVSMGKVPCVIEELVALACEISVIVARTDRGETTAWPVAENRHRHGILDVSIVPARVEPQLISEAREIATQVAAALDYHGLLCVEMFVATDGRLLVNEIAPRPHNSGHYSIDACVTSQFEQQARILAGLPLGETRQHEPAVMVNLLGDIWFDKKLTAREPDWTHVLRHPSAKLHLYGKAEPRRGRKMGHVTCVAPTQREALEVARAIKHDLGIPGADEL
jgi:5-(carboxyamino)imidazole ribonucleotide synthase